MCVELSLPTCVLGVLGHCCRRRILLTGTAVVALMLRVLLLEPLARHLAWDRQPKRGHHGRAHVGAPTVATMVARALASRGVGSGGIGVGC